MKIIEGHKILIQNSDSNSWNCCFGFENFQSNSSGKENACGDSSYLHYAKTNKQTACISGRT